MCDDLWDITDAGVVCRQLGYNEAASAPGLATFGEGSGPIHYDNVACNGTETRLADCPPHGIGIVDCLHSEDAGVVCRIPGQLSSVHLYMLRIVGLPGLLTSLCQLLV